MRGVWEGVLPERRSVEEKERVHVGGEWVKRPKWSEKSRSWESHLVFWEGPRRLRLVQAGKVSKLVAGCPSSWSIEFDISGFRRMFHNLNSEWPRPIAESCSWPGD
jgi:hypothetical protein